MDNKLSKNVPFFPWGQVKYFEGLNDFANSYVRKIKSEKGIDLGHVDVKPFLDTTKDSYWTGLIKQAVMVDRWPFTIKNKKISFGAIGYMDSISYPFNSLSNHVLNHVSTEIISDVGNTTFYVPTGLMGRVCGNLNAEKITSTLNSWAKQFD